jgi:hypothetical protein
MNYQQTAYIQFELQAIEDRDESLKQGRYIAKEIEIAIITLPGSRDTIEKVITPEELSIWKNNPEKQLWVKMYEAWKDGAEAPITGTPIKEWPVLSPKKVKEYLNAGIRSVEDLAALPEDACDNIGFGTRTDRQKARDWIAAANDTGKLVQELETLKVQINGLLTETERLRADNASLAERLGEGAMSEARLSVKARKQ